jgi:hypothetical protein
MANMPTLPSIWRACGDIGSRQTSMVGKSPAAKAHPERNWTPRGNGLQLRSLVNRARLGRFTPPKRAGQGAPAFQAPSPASAGALFEVKWATFRLSGTNRKRRNVAGASRVGDFALGDSLVE